MGISRLVESELQPLTAGAQQPNQALQATCGQALFLRQDPRGPSRLNLVVRPTAPVHAPQWEVHSGIVFSLLIEA